MPMFASTTLATVVHTEPAEEDRERRQGDELHEHEKDQHGDRLPEPDGAAVARSQQQAVHQPLLALGHERAHERQRRGEEDTTHSRLAPTASGPPSVPAKWKTTSPPTTKSTIAGSVCARAVERHVLARQHSRVVEVASHARPSPGSAPPGGARSPILTPLAAGSCSRRLNVCPYTPCARSLASFASGAEERADG